MATPLPLDRVTALALDPGAKVVVHGLVTTSIDGSAFDPAMQWDGLAGAAAAPRPGGLFDLAAGGLRLVEQHPERHEYVLAATGVPGAACAAAGASSPCLVPRLATLAHERLRTGSELAATLTGDVELDGAIAPPPPPVVTDGQARALGAGGALVLLALAAWLVLAWMRRRARTEMGRVLAAARVALRALHRDPTLDAVRRQVRAMVDRASTLEAARRACLRRLAGIDRAALERKRDAHARSNAPEAADALAWLTAECAEAERLESDLASSVLGLQRIESALRVVALRVREHRGTRARSGPSDPVDLAAEELRLRDEALHEADRAIAP